jgi:hypothetical protein
MEDSSRLRRGDPHCHGTGVGDRLRPRAAASLAADCRHGAPETEAPWREGTRDQGVVELRGIRIKDRTRHQEDRIHVKNPTIELSAPHLMVGVQPCCDRRRRTMR